MSSFAANHGFRRISSTVPQSVGETTAQNVQFEMQLPSMTTQRQKTRGTRPQSTTELLISEQLVRFVRTLVGKSLQSSLHYSSFCLFLHVISWNCVNRNSRYDELLVQVKKRNFQKRKKVFVLSNTRNSTTS